MSRIFVSNTLGRQFARTDAPSSFLVLRILLTVFTIFVAVSSSDRLSATQEKPSDANRDNLRLLSSAETIRRDMKGGEVHTYQLPLALNQFTQIVVEQFGIDVDLKISGPDGRTLIEVDSPNGSFGVERASVIAQAAGTHTITVKADKTPPSGSYGLHVEGPREETPAEEQRLSAGKLFLQARALSNPDTPDNRPQARPKYTQG